MLKFVSSIQFASVSFAITLVFLVVIPEYGLFTLAFTGVLMMFSNLVYYLLFPGHLRTIVVEGSPMVFQFGESFILVFISGFLNLCAGLSVLAVNQLKDIKAISTFFELDFDTPWDHKVSIFVLGAEGTRDFVCDFLSDLLHISQVRFGVAAICWPRRSTL